jgi:3-oxoacyl-[acyl-carrier protein] reductase
MNGSLEGKRAFVTGSSSGIGAAVARRLAADGAVVAVHGRDAARTQAIAESIRADGGQAHVVLGSLSSDSEAASVADAVEAVLGAVDVLVNNAGGESAGGGHAPWFDASAQMWLDTYQANVASMVRMIRRFAPSMQARGWGRLIQLSSSVVDAPMTLIPDYQAAKAAIRALTKSLAHTLAHTGVTVNSVSPGLIVTPNVKTWIRSIAAQRQWSEDWADIEHRAARELVPNLSGRLGRPEDIANAIAFLASPAAGYVNATDILVDGGH